MAQLTQADPIIFFDGVCNLCTQSVQFILRRDPDERFRFASLQSDLAAEILPRYGRQADILSTFVLLEADQMYDRSTAALRVARRLKFPWWLAGVGFLIPRPVRDWLYDQIAMRRYRWFGQRADCWLPSPALQARFLDSVDDLGHGPE